MYFATLNYISYPDVGKEEKVFLSVALAVLLVSSYSIAIMPLNNISVMLWGTLFYWGSISAILLKNAKVRQ